MPFDERADHLISDRQGYATGYLIGAVINLTVVQYNKYHWRSLYWIGAGFSIAAAIVRSLLPESRQFLLAREEAKANGLTSKQTSKLFLVEIKNMFKTNCQSLVRSITSLDGSELTLPQGSGGSGLFA